MFVSDVVVFGMSKKHAFVTYIENNSKERILDSAFTDLSKYCVIYLLYVNQEVLTSYLMLFLVCVVLGLMCAGK